MSFLLAVEEPGGAVHLGLPAFYRYAMSSGKSAARHVDLHPRYFYPLGRPTETHKPEDIDNYMVKGTHSYRRTFEGGVVVINPGFVASDTVPLGGSYVDPASGKAQSSVTLLRGTAAILLSSK